MQGLNKSSLKKMNVVDRALRIALKAHGGQKRKVDDLPFIVHPAAVALKLSRNGFSDTVVAAALAHDVLEDTDYPENELREILGNEVVDIVKVVTKDSSLPWRKRKEKVVEDVRKGSEEAKAVAIADKINNVSVLIAGAGTYGKNTWKKYQGNKEKKIWFHNEMLEMFKETWDHPFIKEYEDLIKKMEKLDS